MSEQTSKESATAQPNVAATNGGGLPATIAGPPRSSEIVAVPHAPQASAADPRILLGALRRRWLVAAALGLGCAAVAATAAWFLVPTPYRAYSELTIRSVPEKILYKTAESQADFGTYKQSRMRDMKGPFVLLRALREPGISNLSLIAAQEHPQDWLEDNLSVSSPGTEFLQLSLSGEQPQELAKIVNAVTTAFLDEVVNAEETARRSKLDELETIYNRIQEDLKQKHRALRELTESLHTTNPETLSVKHQLALDYSSKLRKDLADLRLEFAKATIELEARRSGSDSMDNVEIPENLVEYQITLDPEFQRLSGRAERLDAMAEQYKRIVGEESDRYRQALQNAEAAEKDLQTHREKLAPLITERMQTELLAKAEADEAQLETTVALLKNQVEQLQKELDQTEVAEKKTGTLSFEAEMLNKQIAQIETMAQDVGSEIKKLEIELQVNPRINLYRRAEVPYVRDTSRRNRLTALAGVGAFGLMLGLVVFMEVQARRISSLNEVVDGLSIRVMGALPLMPRWATNGAGGRRSGWQTALNESVDSTRTLLLRDASLESVKAVMIASAQPGEGKTTLACHLATSLARAGRTSLLVDCDLRRPGIHKVFDVPSSPGLCEVLRGEADLDSVIQPTATDGLSIVPAGHVSQAVLRKLAQGEDKPVFDELKRRFDFVTVDSSPVLPVNDSLLIAQHVDAVVLAIRRDVSRFSKVDATCRRLSMLGIPLLGAVVIGLDDGSYDFRYPSAFGYRYAYPYQYGPYSTPPPR